MGRLRSALPRSARGGFLAAGAALASLTLVACTNASPSRGAGSRPPHESPFPPAASNGQRVSSPTTSGMAAVGRSSDAAISGPRSSDRLGARMPVLVAGETPPTSSGGSPSNTPAESGVPRDATTEYCPFTFGDSPAGPDPDYVTFLGPARIPLGATTPVSVGISEEESTPNIVSIAVVATASDDTNPISATETGTHDTEVSVALPGVAGRTYTLHWVATFDNFAHPCSSEIPGYAPYSVTSAS